MAHREEDDVRLNDVVSDASESDEGSESEASSSEDEQLSASMSSRAARRRVVGDESVGSMSQRGMQESSDAGKSEQSGKYGERRPSRSDPSPPPPLKRATSGLKSAAQVRAKREKEGSGLFPIGEEGEEPHEVVSDRALDAIIAEAEAIDDPGMAPHIALPKKLQKLLTDEAEGYDITFVVDGSSRYITHDERLQISQKGHLPFMKKKNRCGCSSKDAWTYTIPYIPVQLLPVTLVNFILVGLFLLFYYVWDDYFLDEVRIFRYFIFLLVWFNGYFVAVVLFHWLNLILTAIVDKPKFQYYSDELESTVAFVGWSIAFAIVWPYLLFPSFGATTAEVFRILSLALITIALIHFAKVLAMKLLLGYRQREAFYDRIDESLYKERVLIKLVNGPMPDWQQRHKASEAVKFYPLRRTVHDPRTFDSLVNQVLRNERMSITGRSRTPTSDSVKNRWQSKYFDPNYGKGDEAREEASTLLAKHLFQKMCRRKRAPWVLEAKDFRPYFSSELKAKHAYLLFNRSSDTKGFISMQEMIEAVKQIYTDRSNLAKSLRNHNKITGILRGILNIVAFLIFIVVFLIVVGVDVLELVVPYTAFLLGFSFIFGDALKNAFHAFIFIFFVNAYDVGDMIDITQDGGYAVVEDMTLLTTHAFYTDGRKVVVSNASMLGRDIVNYTKSRNFGFGIEIWIKADTPIDKIQLLRQRLTDYQKLLPQLWNGISCHLRELDRSDSLKLFVWGELKGITWAVWAQNAPRTQLYFYVQEQINDLGIIGYLPPQQLIFDPRSAPLELKPHKKMRRMFEGRNPSRRLRKDKEE